MEEFIQLTCQRCGHSWIPNVPNPIVCPRCHTPYWNKPRRNSRPPLQRVIPNTFHQEPLVTETPQVVTPNYVHVEPHVVYTAPPEQYIQPPVVSPQEQFYPQRYPELPTSYLVPPEPVFQEVNRDYIQPDRDMPLPLRKCKLCGYKGYGDSFRNHNCRR